MKLKEKKLEIFKAKIKKLAEEIEENDFNGMGEYETRDYFAELVQRYNKRDFDTDFLAPCFCEKNEEVNICLDMGGLKLGRAIYSALAAGYEMGRQHGYYEGAEDALRVCGQD